ncbi:type II and III secretion system protein family protein [Sphingomonas nostoxanthinifaciens]|uniref:type II and III secretion system protein family protein n=1 Tax=Sphingomonas nostoxanthinifaciens TaxID=2872652 RepID=UPI001CC1F6CA|nr:type II and III secretion system protein family protein [Sphingomonas nostoxanthinifaciens]UAK24105.1 type II and III secretion system protein family protein [Sphingomonas nostoxanthinifaciens]
MRSASFLRQGGMATLIAALVSATLAALASPARAEEAAGADVAAGASSTAAQAVLPARTLSLSVSSGELIRMPRPISGMFVADDSIADVQVKSTTQLYLFGKKTGQTSVYATDKNGHVVWSSNVRVGNGLTQVGEMLRLAMPEDDITATPVGGMVLLTGTVLSPKDAEEAERLTDKFTGGSVQILNRLKIATPQQVMLAVKIAEVSRSVIRNIGVNLANRAQGNPLFHINNGTPGTLTTNTTGLDSASGTTTGQTIATFNDLAGTTLGIAGHVFGADFIASLQLYEQDGLVTTLAEPNLVALSGETATFLAGGEIPIPQSQGLGSTSVEFKQYGVSLAFTPTVMSAGRIALRVRPEVSQLSDSGSVKVNGFSIPALTTRRVETTIELGSGQSFAIGGLLQNSHNNNTDKAPFLGDLPIIGALFRSNGFRKDETELIVVVTPYLVKPTDAKNIALPTDGYRMATTAERVLEDRSSVSDGAKSRPLPTAAGTTAPEPVKP